MGGGATPEGKVTVSLLGWWGESYAGDKAPSKLDISKACAAHRERVHEIRNGLKRDPQFYPLRVNTFLDEYVRSNRQVAPNGKAWPPSTINHKMLEANFQGRWALPFIFCLLTGRPAHTVKECLANATGSTSNKRHRAA